MNAELFTALELLEKEYTASSTPVGTLYRLKSSQ